MNDRPPPAPRPSESLELRAALLVGLLVLLVAASAAYLLYARGVFEPSQRLVLMADDAEGVTVGMDLTFAGFPIGRVRAIELAADGTTRIVIDVPRKDARWLRESSVFTLTRGLLGNTNLRAFSGVLSDPPLPAGAERRVLVGDATAEIPRLVSETRDLIKNLTQLTSADSALATYLGNIQSATEKIKGPRGALGVLFGNEADAQKLVVALDRTNTLAGAHRWPGRQGRPAGVRRRRPDARSACGRRSTQCGAARGTRKPEKDRRDPGRRAGHRRQRARRIERPRRVARRSRRQPAQGEPHDRGGQSSVAVREVHGDQAAMKRVGRIARSTAASFALLLAACSSPPPLEWQANAKAALDDAVAAYLVGDTRVANARIRSSPGASSRAPAARTRSHWRSSHAARCRSPASTSGRAQGSSSFGPTPLLQNARTRTTLSGRVQTSEVALLPEPHRALAARDLSGDAAAAALKSIDDPLSRLVATGVLFQTGRANPAAIALAADTASAQGWRRPLLAWLGVQLALAQKAGDQTGAEQLRRRIALVEDTK